ncbi:MAG: M48 family metallopeptidase [Pseudomonadota bacterium]
MTMVRVGAVRDRFEGRGLFLDGEGAELRKVALRIDETSGTLMGFEPAPPDPGPPTTGDDLPPVNPPQPGPAFSWPLDDIRRVPGQAGEDVLALRLTSNATQRLLLTTPGDRHVLQTRASHLWQPAPVTGKARLAIWGSAAVASVALMIFVLIPLLANNLATVLPASGQRALGETVLEDIRVALDRTGVSPVATCDGAAGRAALTAMEERLFPDGLGDVELSVFVLDHPMINAFALPGGIVVLMRGLIEEAETADEVAAVFAHEVGHVINRDPSRIALRSVGSVGVLGLLFGDFAGGALLLFLTNQMIAADYSQEAEANADAFATATLQEAGIPAEALATFFERLLAQHGDPDGLAAQFLAHPSLSTRIAAAREGAEDLQSSEPVITAQDWSALRNICAETP